jgi:5-methyltetrahydropteroyltriglutamate--homocysteine methyltransferase
LGRESVDAIVKKQQAAGVDIGNNGEQQREGFFLHIRHRMTGFGGSWTRRTRGDALRYPVFKRQMDAFNAAREAVSNMGPPKAVSEIRYRGGELIEEECRDFRAALDKSGQRFVEPFLTAPSPGIIAAAMKNEYYDSEEAYLAALGSALKLEYETIVRHGFLLQLDCPDLALERHLSYQDRPLADFLGFVERVIDTINKALVAIPRDQVRLHVCWGNYEGPHDMDVPLSDILPILLQAKVGALVLPFANPRHGHEYKVLKAIPLQDDQLIVAGVVDSLTNFVEHPELIADRLEHIAAAVGDPRRVVACTDCGFDTSAGMGRVVAPVGGAVERPRQQTEHQREAGALVPADRQQEPVIGAGRVGQRAALAVDHPAFRHRLALLRGDLDLAIGGDRRRHVEDERRFFECRHGNRDRVGGEQHVDAAPGRQMVGVADREVEPDHVVGERHRGINRGGARVVAVPHADPADPARLRDLDRGLRRALHRERTRTVVAVDECGRCPGSLDPDVGGRVHAARLDAPDILRQAEDAVPIGPGEIGPQHQLGGRRGVTIAQADRPVGGGDKGLQLGAGHARHRRVGGLGHGSSPRSQRPATLQCGGRDREDRAAAYRTAIDW